MTSAPPRVAVFTVAPILVVTIEGHASHVNVGGQGVWVARAIATLGGEPVICAPFGGDTGRTAQLILAADQYQVAGTDTDASSGLYVEQRDDDGARTCVQEVPAERLRPRDLDDVYEAALLHGTASGTCVVTGSPFPGHLDPDTVRRLCNDLHAAGVVTVADLSGEQLSAALDAGVDLLKIADDQLGDNGIDAGEGVDEWMADVLGTGQVRRAVVVSSADGITRARTPSEVIEAKGPRFDAVDPRGSGDSMCAAIALAHAREHPVTEAIRIGIAAGAANATRRSTASPGIEAVLQLSETVELTATPIR